VSDLAYYAGLLEDRERIRAFLDAIAATVRPGDVVLEIGGGLGTYALAAKQRGAREVVAVDTNPLVLAHARELGVERAGVKLVESPVERLQLAEPADVVIFEDYGSFGTTARLRSIFEAAARLSKPTHGWVPLSSSAQVRT